MNLQGSQTGIELRDTYGSPKPMAHHCSMMVNATTAFITGGYRGRIHSRPANNEQISRETYFVDVQNWKLTKGPEMKEGRYGHGCAVFMHNNVKYAIVAGGQQTYDYLTSTEILDMDSGIVDSWRRWTRRTTGK